MARQLISFLCLLLFSMSAYSANYKIYKEDDKSRAKITNNKPVKLFYEKASWNTDPTEIESGFLFLRDMKTGEVLELRLSETEPNSSVFELALPIGGLQSSEVHAEIYSVPPSMLSDKGHLKTVKDLLSKSALKRKPFLLRVLRKKGQLLDVFDSKESALASYESYKRQLGINDNVESQSIIEVKKTEKPVVKKIIDTSTLQSLFMANDAGNLSTNLKNKELRDVLLKIEKKRRNAVISNGRTWPQSTRDKNKKTSVNLMKKGLANTKNKNYKSSVSNFLKGSDLRPQYEDLYQYYGVSLYNQEKYNQSIVVLTLAKPSRTRVVEKEFYLGMNFFKLKDYESAIKHFDNVMKMDHPKISPSAAFYKGSALKELKRFDESKVAFQYVLDKSDNPEMDKRAEKFIEHSIQQKALEQRRSNRFFYSGVLGVMHDDNITLALDASRDQGTAGDLSGWRLMGQGNIKYRPYYSQSDEVAVAVDALGIQSFKDDFGSSKALEQADPYVFGIKVPWTHRGTFKDKGYTFDLEPVFETILMDFNNEDKKQILMSMVLNFRNTLVVNKNWIAKADFHVRNDDSGILNDAPDAFNAGATFSSIFVINQDLERYLIPDLGYIVNSAKGKDYAYNRLSMGISYSTSIFDFIVWTNRLGFYIANYKSVRVDNNYNLTSSLGYSLSPSWNLGVNAAYTINDSNTNHYNKLTVMTTLSFSY